MLSVRVRLRYPKSAGTAGWIFLWFFLFFSLFLFVLFVLFVLFFFSAFIYSFFFLRRTSISHCRVEHRFLSISFIYIFYLYLSPLPSSPPNFQVFDFIKMPV